MKKTYISPAIRVKHIEVQSDLLQSSISISSESGNGLDNDAKRGIQFGNFGSADGAKSSIDWDDEE